MRARIFLEHPDDVKQAVMVLLWLFSVNPRPRPLYGRCIKHACRLLKVMAVREGSDVHWILAKEAKHRLELAGMKGHEVKNERRWANAWAQLQETHTFKNDVAQRDIATGRRSPRAEPRVKAIAVRARKKRVQGEATFKMPKL
jgi:hypothetical protein